MKNLKRDFPILKVLISLILWYSPGIASTNDFKLGFIDSEVIFERYQGTADLKKQLEEDMKLWENSLREKKKEIEDLYVNLESQKLMLSDEAREKKELEIRSKEREYETFVTEIFGSEGKARKREKELTQPLLDRIQQILDRLSAEEGYEIIFDLAEGGIVYGRPALNLTERVLEELNQEFTTPLAGLKRKEIYVFPLRNSNTPAREEEIGIKITQLLETALLKSPIFERARGNVGNALVDLGVEKPEEITDVQALQVGRNANIAMVVLGEVSKMGATIEVNVDLLDVSKGIVIATEKENSKGDRDQEIAEMINTLAGKLVKKAE